MGRDSGYEGVHWNRFHKKWQAQVVDDGRNLLFGRFAMEHVEIAAVVYDLNILQLFGTKRKRFKKLNFTAVYRRKLVKKYQQEIDQYDKSNKRFLELRAMVNKAPPEWDLPGPSSIVCEQKQVDEVAQQDIDAESMLGDEEKRNIDQVDAEREKSPDQQQSMVPEEAEDDDDDGYFGHALEYSDDGNENVSANKDSSKNGETQTKPARKHSNQKRKKRRKEEEEEEEEEDDDEEEEDDDSDENYVEDYLLKSDDFNRRKSSTRKSVSLNRKEAKRCKTISRDEEKLKQFIKHVHLKAKGKDGVPEHVRLAKLSKEVRAMLSGGTSGGPSSSSMLPFSHEKQLVIVQSLASNPQAKELLYGILNGGQSVSLPSIHSNSQQQPFPAPAPQQQQMLPNQRTKLEPRIKCEPGQGATSSNSLTREERKVLKRSLNKLLRTHKPERSRYVFVESTHDGKWKAFIPIVPTSPIEFGPFEFEETAGLMVDLFIVNVFQTSKKIVNFEVETRMKLVKRFPKHVRQTFGKVTMDEILSYIFGNHPDPIMHPNLFSKTAMMCYFTAKELKAGKDDPVLINEYSKAEIRAQGKVEKKERACILANRMHDGHLQSNSVYAGSVSGTAYELQLVEQEKHPSDLYHGVFKCGLRWMAILRRPGELITLGSFMEEQLAALLVDVRQIDLMYAGKIREFFPNFEEEERNKLKAKYANKLEIILNRLNEDDAKTNLNFHNPKLLTKI